MQTHDWYELAKGIALVFSVPAILLIALWWSERR